jgi:four helix bundle protein
MEQIQSYDELRAWQEAMTLAAETHRTVRDYPSEGSALAAATGATAIDVVTSIAEGWATRFATKEIRAHLQSARRELYRLENQLVLALRLGYLTRQQMDVVWPMTQTTGQYIAALIRTI